MTYSPGRVWELSQYWIAKGGVSLGIVGDSAHAARASYHNGYDRIIAYGRTRTTDYSIRQDRDWAGKTNAASALDLGRLDGSLDKLYAFSRWLAARCQDNAVGTGDIREVIFSPDGKRVLRWDHVTKTVYLGGDGTGHGDNSHLWHTHISFYRDSEYRPKLGLFAPFFEQPVPVPTPEEDNMLEFTIAATPGGQIKVLNGKMYEVKTGVLVEREDNYLRNVIARVRLVKPFFEDYVDGWLVTYDGGRPYFVLAKDAEWIAPPKPIDDSPYTKAELDAAVRAAVNAAIAPLNQRITRLLGVNQQAATALTDTATILKSA